MVLLKMLRLSLDHYNLDKFETNCFCRKIAFCPNYGNADLFWACASSTVGAIL